jgi:hypothetical protein
MFYLGIKEQIAPVTCVYEYAAGFGGRLSVLASRPAQLGALLVFG